MFFSVPDSLSVIFYTPLPDSVLDINYTFSGNIIKIEEQEGVYILSRRHATDLGSNFLINFVPSHFLTFVEI